jgi:ABC-type multidrug transport system ATPase subunit
MRRRLDLAASLLGEPEVLFLDEPTTGLDPRARLQVWETIRRVVAGGATVLASTPAPAGATGYAGWGRMP